MKEHLINNIPVAFTGTATVLTTIFGGWDRALQVLVILVVTDIVTGYVKGFIRKELSSRRMREGLVSKLGYFIVVVLANQFDQLLPSDSPILRTVVIWFYIFVEGTSILENLAQMGVPIPQEIVNRLSALKTKGGDVAEIGADGKFVSRETKRVINTYEEINKEDVPTNDNENPQPVITRKKVDTTTTTEKKEI